MDGKIEKNSEEVNRVLSLKLIYQAGINKKNGDFLRWKSTANEYYAIDIYGAALVKVTTGGSIFSRTITASIRINTREIFQLA